MRSILVVVLLCTALVNSSSAQVRPFITVNLGIDKTDINPSYRYSFILSYPDVTAGVNAGVFQFADIRAGIGFFGVQYKVISKTQVQLNSNFYYPSVLYTSAGVCVPIHIFLHSNMFGDSTIAGVNFGASFYLPFADKTSVRIGKDEQVLRSNLTGNFMLSIGPQVTIVRKSKFIIHPKFFTFPGKIYGFSLEVGPVF